MTSTRKLDQAIRTAEAKLKGVRAKESWALPAKDQAKLASYVAVIVGKGVRGQQSSPRSERGIDTLWANAEARLVAEIRAAETAKQQIINKDAAAKIARKSESKGWW
ncbi:hypothetical protein ACTVZO_45320 [Streptomyces sp. IBSNAI002]|uniref:hypothetical protein n=1 Tax=Streptomyces sp. IBSNAI002 TaxID=3457500 RepID=UPI003FD416E7